MNAISARAEAHELATNPMSFNDIERLGENIAKSGLFGMKTKEQAVVLMMIAQAEGRHPVLAARDYDIIQGRPSKKAEAMLRDFIEAGGKVQWHALTDNAADATFSHPQGGSTRINWDLARANAAGLSGKDMWKKYPRQMLRSRTVSEGVRTVYPLATSGMYVPEEAADFAGPTLEAHAEPEAPKPRRKAEAANNSASMQVGGTGLPDTGGNGDAPTVIPQPWFETVARALEREKNGHKWLALWRRAGERCPDEAVWTRLHTLPSLQFWLDNPETPELVREEIHMITKAGYERLTTPAQPSLTLDAEPWDRETGEITPEERARA